MQDHPMSWMPGEVIVERQVWRGHVAAGFPTIVVEDTPEHLVTYMATGAPFGFTDDMAYPSPTGHHPRYGLERWQGHGMLAVTPKSGAVSVQHYWTGPNRDFACWYLNLQEPMRPTSIGFDSQDLELDIVVSPDGRWTVKDDDLLDQRVEEGRWTSDEVAVIRAIGQRVVSDVLEPGRWWWDTKWSQWEPGDVVVPELPPGWSEVPVAPFAGLLGANL
jgi:hypothetical protein